MIEENVCELKPIHRIFSFLKMTESIEASAETAAVTIVLACLKARGVEV